MICKTLLFFLSLVIYLPIFGVRPFDYLSELPKILLIGDSISMGYMQPVSELLRGKANVYRPKYNCGSTQDGLRHLNEWLGGNKWDVIHFNFGLHDLKYVDDKGRNVDPKNGKQNISLELYQKNLREIVIQLKKTGAKLLWCSTTPIPNGALGRARDSEIEYNKIAEGVMKENGIAINDLYTFIKPKQKELQIHRDVHFTQAGYYQIALHITKNLSQLPNFLT